MCCLGDRDERNMSIARIEKKKKRIIENRKICGFLCRRDVSIGLYSVRQPYVEDPFYMGATWTEFHR